MSGKGRDHSFHTDPNLLLLKPLKSAVNLHLLVSMFLAFGTLFPPYHG